MDIQTSTQLSFLKESLETLGQKIKPGTDIITLNVYRSKLESLEIEAKSFFNAALNSLEEPALKEIHKEYKNFMDQSTELLLVLMHLLPSETPKLEESSKSFTSQLVVPHLPRLHIDRFNGKNDFQLFYSKFSAMVQSNPSLSATSKFHYLISFLEGEPLKLINAFPINEEGYEEALKFLCNKYENRRAAINECLDKILDLPSIASNSASLQNFLDAYHSCIQSLKCYKINIEEGNTDLLVRVLLRKLDKTLRFRFENSLNSLEMPKLEQIINFAKSQLQIYKNSEITSSPKSIPETSSSQKRGLSSLHAFSKPPKASCPFCKAEHSRYACPLFLNWTVQQRFSKVKALNLCLNCLSKHFSGKCNSSSTCAKCQKKHHTLLHFETPRYQVTLPPESPSLVSCPTPAASCQVSVVNPTSSVACSPHNYSPCSAPDPSSCSVPAPSSGSTSTSAPGVTLACNSTSSTILLASVRVKIFTSPHNYIIARGLLDTASQLNFITSRCAKLLNAFVPCTLPSANGVSGAPVKPLGFAMLSVGHPSGGLIVADKEFLVVDEITSLMPSASLDPRLKRALSNYTLSDPGFDSPARVDVLLNASLSGKIIERRIAGLGEGMPELYQTSLGYVLMGEAPVNHPLSQAFNGLISCHVSADQEIASLIKRFSEVDQPPSLPPKREDTACEENYVSTTTRDASGRYEVQLPFRSDSIPLGDSAEIAQRCFFSLEKRFWRQPEFFEKYRDCIRDYFKEGHLQPVTDPAILKGPHYVLPHHGVFKRHGDNQSIRVVFNASQPTSNGLSLNDVLLPGPKLQNQITDLLIVFRIFPFVFSCDIRQMYRQISLFPPHRNFQLIFWRENPKEILRLYQLTTVTFGVSPSAYLAIRTLQQLAKDEGHKFPRAAEALLKNTFVDDHLNGESSLEKAKSLKSDIQSLLALGGFQLRKWCSNHPALLADVPDDQKISAPIASLVGILGLSWDPNLDKFFLKFEFANSTPFSKRIVLSQLAQIYDPCGWVSPIVLWAKIFMRDIWLSKLSWDEILSPIMQERWQSFLQQVSEMKNIEIPRPLYSVQGIHRLIGFCDSSEKGYASVIYLCTEVDNGNYVSLVYSKTRVAPMKVLTLPKLELCGAYLLAQNFNYVFSLLSEKIKIAECLCFSDATVVLSWIHSSPHLFKTFVANRIAQIQELTDVKSWFYVRSALNPADVASRGALPSELADHPLWFNGPSWLSSSRSEWPLCVSGPEVDESVFSGELKGLNNSSFAVTEVAEFPFENFSSWTGLSRVVAWILRFVKNSREQLPSRDLSPSLTIEEVNSAQRKICKLVQDQCLSFVATSLNSGKNLPKQYAMLDPFVDSEGLVRVGGRLKNSALPGNAKHPILLPKNHHVVVLIINYFHLKYFHARSHLLHSLIASHFYIFACRQAIRSVVSKCIACFRVNPVNKVPFMGDLPQGRVVPSPPFSKTGCDFAGPFLVRSSTLRKAPKIKCYFVVFVCFATKAVHLEAVTDLSTAAFLAALARFIARRGIVNHLHCDCGTNLVGASNVLNRTFRELVQKDQELCRFGEEHRIHFHFNSPFHPSSGGLWEAAVKRVKHHLLVTLQNHVPTLEEFTTLLIRIEALLNSRPLTPISTDPSDLSVLTPAHFLIGRPLSVPPDESQIYNEPSLKCRWLNLQHLFDQIWKKWSREYLHTLHQRVKSFKHVPNLKVGTMVLVRDLNLPPIQWPIGRIIEVCPGKDGIVRIIKVKTARGIFTRPALKVFPLPLAGPLLD